MKEIYEVKDNHHSITSAAGVWQGSVHLIYSMDNRGTTADQSPPEVQPISLVNTKGTQ